MSEHSPRSGRDDESYKEYARKMDLFMDGPTTTNFEQLTAAGIQLPEPDAVAEAGLRTKLWEVIAGLAELRVYLDQTDHLSDRELYAKLWHETLRVETAAIDEIGFSSHVSLLQPDGVEPDTSLFLKYYADDKEREWWRQDDPDFAIPPHEDPPYNRDALLPCAHGGKPDAAAWLRANWSASAFATNRFGTTKQALEFVEQLHAAGATGVWIDNIMMLPNHDWTPYADALLVEVPEDPARRHELFEFMEHVGRPDEDAGEVLTDHGQKEVRLWWD
jgi:hypothetical protein